MQVVQPATGDSLRRRLEEVEGRIAAACQSAGRPRASVQMMAVTKVFPAAAILEAYALGLRDFGENYVQEFEAKAPSARALDGARFHLIGHLQSNKSRRAAELFDGIHSVDSEKLARRLNECGKQLEIMIEVKLSEEASKYGCEPAGLPALIGACRHFEYLRLCGLMTMPPWSEDPERARPYFRRLRELAGLFGLEGLSMGMSGDLEVAIEEGSTLVRVGTALFGPRRGT